MACSNLVSGAPARQHRVIHHTHTITNGIAHHPLPLRTATCTFINRTCTWFGSGPRASLRILKPAYLLLLRLHHAIWQRAVSRDPYTVPYEPCTRIGIVGDKLCTEHCRHHPVGTYQMLSFGLELTRILPTVDVAVGIMARRETHHSHTVTPYKLR